MLCFDGLLHLRICASAKTAAAVGADNTTTHGTNTEKRAKLISETSPRRRTRVTYKYKYLNTQQGYTHRSLGIRRTLALRLGYWWWRYATGMQLTPFPPCSAIRAHIITVMYTDQKVCDLLWRGGEWNGGERWGRGERTGELSGILLSTPS